ncbi:MAG: hypothetical protein KA154_17535, partial [Gemmatimonadaceae bacterium]|nr:hypothetical protein [Gemmatimonadaceae bacterium]
MERRTALGVIGVMAAGLVTGVACAPRRRLVTSAARGVVADSSGALFGRLDGIDRMARIALSSTVDAAPLSATARFRIDEQGGRQALVRGTGGEQWRIEQRRGLLRVAGEGDDATPWR